MEDEPALEPGQGHNGPDENSERQPGRPGKRRGGRRLAGQERVADHVEEGGHRVQVGDEPQPAFDQARKVLGLDSIHLISNDYHNALRSLNFGKMLAQLAPRSPMRQDIEKIASQLARAFRGAAIPDGKGSWS